VLRCSSLRCAGNCSQGLQALSPSLADMSDSVSPLHVLISLPVPMGSAGSSRVSAVVLSLTRPSWRAWLAVPQVSLFVRLY
jgi:hypothetical protein